MKFYIDYSPREIRVALVATGKPFNAIHLVQTRSILNTVMHDFARARGIPLLLSSFGSLPRRAFWKYPQGNGWVYPTVKEAVVLLSQTEHVCQVYWQSRASRRVQLRWSTPCAVCALSPAGRAVLGLREQTSMRQISPCAGVPSNSLACSRRRRKPRPSVR